MDLVEKKFKNQPNLYFHRDVVCYSLEGRVLEVVTISSKDGISDEVEEHPDSKDPMVFPNGC